MRRRTGLLGLAGILIASVASAATFVVDSTGDEPDADTADGVCQTALTTCTLRAAIEQANASPGADVIQFNIPGAGVHTIAPAELPFLTDDAGVTIDGYSQPGASPNTLAVGDDAVLLIEIDGSNVGIHGLGFRVLSANATIRGLVMNSFPRSPISIEAGFGHQVVGCFLGTDASGLFAKPNGTAGLIVDFFGSPSAVRQPQITRPPIAEIGSDTSFADRNLISGNGNGIDVLGAQDVLIQGNYVGVDATGAAALPNAGTGIGLLSVDTTVRKNVVSGNIQGISISFGGNSYVAQNLIGTDATGTHSVPNGTGVIVVLESGGSITQNTIAGSSQDGIRVINSSGLSVTNNTIGGTGIGNMGDGISVVGSSAKLSIVQNEIAANGGSGVRIGAQPLDVPEGILVSVNSIHDNGGPGIDLGADGVTPNNDCDNGRGPNLGQNYPVIDFVGPVSGGTRVAGSLNSVPGFQYWLEFYSSPSCDPSGFGEGQTFIGATAVTIPTSDCVVAFDLVLSQTVPPGFVITALARDAVGNTSEFSACRPLTIGQNFYTLPPCRIVDTRDPNGPYGGPALGVAGDRPFVIAGQCGVPVDAQAVALNVAVTQPTNDGHLILFASGTPVPVPPAVNYAAGQTRARDGVFALGLGGGLDAHVHQTSGTVNLILDVTGYFR